MIGIREKHSDSWLDPRCAGVVAFKFGCRLWKRLKGEKGLCFTLTYDRSQFDSSRDLYRKSSEEQHVALFIRKLQRLTGESYKGKWICKMEFQQGGWVHWHIILIGTTYIEHEVLKEAWQRGHVWVGKLSKRNVFYLTKYIAKNSSLPAWLLGERPRSVKVIRVSPGFWLSTEAKGRDPDYEKYRPRRQTMDGYVPLGTKLERKPTSVVRTKRGVYALPMTMGTFLSHLSPRLTADAFRRQGWLVLRTTAEVVDDVVAKCCKASGSGATGRRDSGDPVHLIQTGNPDIGGIPGWLDQLYREEFCQYAT